MHKDVLREKWKHFRSELNDQWAELTSNDLDRVDGKRDNLVVILEHRYGYARRRAEREVDLVVSEFEAKLRRAS
ncbi:MAG TPA: CsbD family protein [Terriglobia bacterium]|nr:CsbD family protein [Terriglobia bacterium]